MNWYDQCKWWFDMLFGTCEYFSSRTYFVINSWSRSICAYYDNWAVVWFESDWTTLQLFFVGVAHVVNVSWAYRMWQRLRKINVGFVFWHRLQVHHHMSSIENPCRSVPLMVNPFHHFCQFKWPFGVNVDNFWLNDAQRSISRSLWAHLSIAVFRSFVLFCFCFFPRILWIHSVLSAAHPKLVDLGRMGCH